jgi:hypothetical protein
MALLGVATVLCRESLKGISYFLPLWTLNECGSWSFAIRDIWHQGITTPWLILSSDWKWLLKLICYKQVRVRECPYFVECDPLVWGVESSFLDSTTKGTLLCQVRKQPFCGHEATFFTGVNKPLHERTCYPSVLGPQHGGKCYFHQGTKKLQELGEIPNSYLCWYILDNSVGVNTPL